MVREHRHPVGMVRREFLQVGFSAFSGMGLPGLSPLRARPAASGAGAGRSR